MRWYSWIFTAILTAVFGVVAAGTLAALLVDWYNVSSFEGGSGFFVVFVGLFGGIAGFVIGLIASLIVSRRSNPGFLKAVGFGWGAALGIVLLIGGIARVLADIPPRLDGETLLLQVELRYPPGRPRPVHVEGAYTRLHSSTLSSVRKSEDGPLWLEDAREENGQWIVPGAVDLFTQRGRRLVDLGIGDKPLAGFIVPLPGHPRAEHESWSDWLPKPAGAEPAGDGFTYRFRVVRRDSPIRTVRSGPFEIAVISSGFFHTSGTDEMASRSMFRVTHQGQSASPDRIDYVAIVNGATPTLFIRALSNDGEQVCRFLVSNGSALESKDLGGCVDATDIAPLTSDPAVFMRARQRKPLEGWPDRLTFQLPGLYLAGDLVVDTRSLTARRYERPTSPYPVSGVPPLAVSPDERSLVLLAKEDSQDVLVVCETFEERSYTVPIDRRRMRYSSDAVLEPGWVNHHFSWVKDADGHDTLRERAAFEPLPYKGEFTDERQAPSYSVGPGKEPLRDAVVSILTTELGGEAMPEGNYGFTKRVRLNGKIIEVTVIESGPYVYVSYEGHDGDVEFLRGIAARLDVAFATRKWDRVFGDTGQ